MRLALVQARRGLGRTSPNPAVGAVIVKDGHVVGHGHHERAGGPHAEIVALKAAGAQARGADLFCTLEPCDHTGRTGPCSAALIEAGIGTVYCGSRDPNPLVDGKGVARLRRAGVRVIQDVLREECDAHLAPWLHFMLERRPFVTLKSAITLDGRIATRTGDARWVSGPAARMWTRRLRDHVDAVLVGRGTALADDPLLTTRSTGASGRNPLRVVLDTELRLPRELAVFRTPGEARTVVVHASDREPDVRLPAVEHLALERAPGGVDLRALLARLYAAGVVHLLVEGGATLNASFLESGLVDSVAAFGSPRLAGSEGVPRMGRDVLILGSPARNCATRVPAPTRSIQREQT